MKLEKKRYIKFRVQTLDGRFSEQDAKHSCYESVFSLWGEAGASKARLKLIAFNPVKQEGVLSCRLAFLDQAIASLALKTSFAGKPVALRPLEISGTLASLGINRSAKASK